MTEIKDCLPEGARKYFIDLRNIRLEAETGKYRERLVKLRAKIAARNQGRSGWQEMEEWKYKEELFDALATGYVQDAFKTCQLYDIPLTKSICDCLVKAVEELLEIQYQQVLRAQGQGLADVRIPISVLQQGNLRSRKVMAQIRVTIEAARVEDEKERVANENDGEDDRRFAQMAIEEARKSVSEDERPHPKVGAIVVKDGKILSKAHRGEKPKSHAEYIALEDKLPDHLVAGATVYTTLEPCTTRKHPKIPCAQRLIDRRVARVVIGMPDPNPDIRGLGDQLLSDAGIEVQLFPRDLRAQVEEMNREFIRAQKQRQATAGPAVESDPNEYWEQRKRLPETDLLRKIWSKPHWRIWIRPTEFRPARFQNLDQCWHFITSSDIRDGSGAAFPSFAANDLQRADEWIACETAHSSRSQTWAERWTLFRSGQFIRLRTLDEIPQLGGRVHALEILDTVTASFEFAARMADRGVLCPRAAITLELKGVAGRGLTWPRDIHMDDIEGNCWCQEETVTAVRQLSTDELRLEVRELAIDAALEVYSKFNWTQPPVEKLKGAQFDRFRNIH